MESCRSYQISLLLKMFQRLSFALRVQIPCDGHKDPRRAGQGLPNCSYSPNFSPKYNGLHSLPRLTVPSAWNVLPFIWTLLAHLHPLNHSTDVTTSERSSLTTSSAHPRALHNYLFITFMGSITLCHYLMYLFTIYFCLPCYDIFSKRQDPLVFFSV